MTGEGLGGGDWPFTVKVLDAATCNDSIVSQLIDFCTKTLQCF